MRPPRRRTCPTPIRGRIRVNDIFHYRGGALYAEELPVAHIAAAVMSPRDASAPQDEREKLITLKANSASGYVLATGVVMTIGVIFLGVKDFLVINLLFFSLVLSEVYKNVNQIVLYRRGA